MAQRETRHPDSSSRLIPLVPFGLGLSLFATFTYVICILGYLFVPGLPIQHSAMAIFLPGFELLSWQSFLLGLAEVFLGGWYVTLIFVPLFNFFTARLDRS